MNKPHVYYFGTYDRLDSKYKRRYAISATAKIDYVLSAINEAGFSVEVISASYLLENKWCFDKGGKRKINDNTTLNLSPGFGYKTIIGKYFSILFTSFFFFIKLLKIRKNETLIVYHGGWYSKPVYLAKKLKKFKLIVEVEEIYIHAFNRNIKGLKKELNFIKSADALILVNDLLADYLNFPQEKVLISYGPYYFDEKPCSSRFKDEKIHIVYAGSFSKRKGGAQAAVASAQFLSQNYVIHILGFGDRETTTELIELIENVNSLDKALVIFEGEKRGLDYENFIKKCDIGLCTQLIKNDYTLYAFPSKVLAYMGYGLNVVTSPLQALPVSSLHSYLNYYYTDSPEDLAEAIINARMYSRKQLIKVVETLHENFVNELKTLI